MKPLSIAFIRQRYAEDGGAERIVARTFEALKGQDVRITLITREWKPGDGFDVIRVNPFYIGRLWRDWSFSRAVQRVVKARRFDLVQSHERIPGCDIYRAGDGVHREWLAQRARVLPWWKRLVQTINPYHRYVKCAEHGVFTSPRLRAVICNSKMVKQEIKDYFGVADEKLHVIYNGVNLKEFNPALRRRRDDIRGRYQIPDNATLFLFVGSGFERKGVPALLRAMAETPPECYLLVVGRDRKMRHYIRSAERLGLKGRVHFAGGQPDVKPYYGAADALVLPTLYDPFPNVILEALACGLPVLTSTKSGGAEFIEAGRSGYVCDALDHVTLARHMRELTNRSMQQDMSSAAHRRVESADLTQMGNQLDNLYKSCMRPTADGLNVVHTESSLGWGGQEIRVLTEMSGMMARGHTVMLLCPREARIYDEAMLRGIPVTALPIARKSFAALRAVRKWLKDHRVDVVNTHSSVDSWLVALASVGFEGAPPMVRTRHISAPIPRNAPTRWLYTRATQYIVTTGEALRRQLVEENGFPEVRISSVPTGIDTSHFVPGNKAAARSRLNLAQDGTFIGIVATLRSWKGHRYLLDAFAQLSDRNARLLVVGDGPMRDAIKEQAVQLQLGDRLIMPGNQRDVVPWLQAMDIFVLPSYANEGVPQAILQAMACGLPVVTTPIGAITEAVDDNVDGLIVEPQNVDALRAAIERLLADQSLCQRLSAAATKRAQERFSLDRMVHAMESVFRQASHANG